MKPIIGVTPDFNAGDRPELGGKEPSYFLRARYARAIEALGGLPLILPLTHETALQRQLLDGLDGLLLTGSGPDLPPHLYGERKRFPYRLMSEQRYTFELAMARLAVRNDLPVLGICGGMQTLNVAFGGSLVQDIPRQLATPIAHSPNGPATNVAHGVAIAAGSLLRRIVRRAHLRVNSSHHQSVKTVAPSLTVSAVAPDGVIEAIEAKDRRRHRFLLGVQWHPEYLYDRDILHRRLFLAFLRAARGR